MSIWLKVVIAVLLGLILLEALARLWPGAHLEVHDRPKSRITRELAANDYGGQTLQILVVGDGYTSGRNVLGAQTYPRHLEWLLNTASRVPYRVHNLAVDGASTRDEIEVLKTAIGGDATLVLVGYFLDDPYVGSGPPEELRSLHQRLGSTGWLGGWLGRHVVLYRRLRALADTRLLRRAQREFIRTLHDPESSSWRQHQQVLAQLGTLGADGATEVRVIVWPHLGFRLDDGYPFTDIHQRLRLQMADAGLQVLDLLDVFRGRDHRRLQAIPLRDPHPNEIAHRIAGEAIFDWLRETKPELADEVVAPRLHPNPPNWLGNRDLEPLVDLPF